MSLRSQIIGTWELASFAMWPPEDPSHKIYPMGTSPVGIHIFTSSGFTSAQILNPGQPHYASHNPFGATTEEYAEASRRYMGWTGPFSVEESSSGSEGAQGSLTYEVTACNFPNQVGNKQERALKLEDGDLVVSSMEGESGAAGSGMRLEYRWKRTKEDN